MDRGPANSRKRRRRARCSPARSGTTSCCGRIARSVNLWRTTYYHALAGGAAAVVEWFKGSGLRPFLEPLSEDERGAYLSRYTAAISGAYPPLADGSVLLPFPRLFMIAIR